MSETIGNMRAALRAAEAGQLAELEAENARLRAVVAKVTRQTNQLMDGTDFYLLPGQVVRDAKAALEVSDAE